VLVNAVDRRANKSVERDIRQYLGLTAEHTLLVMVGNRKRGFSFDFVTAMLQRLPRSVHIAFVGRGYDADEKEHRDGGVRDRLHFVPAVPSVEVSSFIAAADLGLLLYETQTRNYRGALPNGFFHAVDAGLAIARFPLPEVEALAGQASIGPILDCTDPTRAAAALATFLADAAARKAAAAAASTLGRSLTWDAQEQLLRKIVEPPHQC
jgi:hypothetical protein